MPARKAKQSGALASATKQDVASDGIDGPRRTSTMTSLPSASGLTTSKDAQHRHLPPFPLVATVLACSGIMWVLAFRDVFATGRNIAGPHDAAMLAFTKSTRFFDDTKGWKSMQGGLSAIMPASTDANDMGGLFVRKLGGAASLVVHTQKLMPLLFHTRQDRWDLGHFKPTLWLSFFSNLTICGFLGTYMSDFAAAAADGLPVFMMATLLVESIVMLLYLMTNNVTRRQPAVKLPAGKTPKSLTSSIVARTVGIVSSLVATFSARDLFMPGQIIDFIPRDDIYLEWTGAFIHSPPDGTDEAEEYAMAADLHVGEKYLCQFLGLHMLLICSFKFFSAFGIRYGSDGSGLKKCGMIWKAQAVGAALILLLFRLFSAAALTASLDLRWHLMCLAYEAFILGLYGFF